MTDLKQLHDAIRACKACPLAATAKQKVIIRGHQPKGKGISPAVLFVGEAPGADEDEQGLPFVGRAGKLLQEAIDEAKLDSYAIINVCKCRPPENRKPLPEEIAVCKGFLEKQLEILKPRIIVPLGDTALKFFLPNSGSISTEAGIYRDGIFPIMHPAYYLRNQTLVPQFKQHIAMLKKNLGSPEGKVLIEYPAVNLQKAENEGKFEMISSQLAAVHILAKEAGITFKDINQKDVCWLDSKKTYVKQFKQTNEIDIFMEELEDKLKDTELFLFYAIEQGDIKLIGTYTRHQLDALEVGMHFQAQKAYKKIMYSSLNKPTDVFKIYRDQVVEHIEPEKYVPLHCHNGHSVGDGYGKPADIAEDLRKKGFAACAITDHGTLQGTIYMQKALNEKNIKPILGMEAYVIFPNDEARYHLVLLVKNETGWKRLLKLQEKACTEDFYYKPRMQFADIIAQPDGLIAMTACTQGVICKPIIEGKLQEAEDRLMKLQQAFKDDLYLEIMPNGRDEQKVVNTKLLEWADKYNIKCVCTTDAHYCNKEDEKYHKAIKAIALRKKYSEAGFDEPTFYLQRSEEMIKYFEDNHSQISKEKIAQMMQNTFEVASKCEFKIVFEQRDTLPKVQRSADFADIYTEFDEWKTKALSSPKEILLLTYHDRVPDE